MRKHDLCAILLSLCLLAGCSGGTASVTPSPRPTAAPVPGVGMEVKTGLAMVADLGQSKSADGGQEGTVLADMILVALTVTEKGVINSCVIDGVRAQMGLDASGRLTTAADTKFPSKNELGESYGMKGASSIGREWSEQADAFARYAQGKTVEELKGMSLDADGRPAEADLTGSVTLKVGNFLAAIEKAAASAAYRGAQLGNELRLASITAADKSRDAAGGEAGLVQISTTAAAVTLAGENITSCILDGIQAETAFDTAGRLTGDLTAPIRSKNELGEEYGMKKSSAIGREWNEQAAAFSEYVRGKTAGEVSRLSVTGEGRPSDADLAATVTIRVGDFLELIQKAAG